MIYAIDQSLICRSHQQSPDIFIIPCYIWRHHDRRHSWRQILLCCYRLGQKQTDGDHLGAHATTTLTACPRGG